MSYGDLISFLVMKTNYMEDEACKDAGDLITGELDYLQVSDHDDCTYLYLVMYEDGQFIVTDNYGN